MTVTFDFKVTVKTKTKIPPTLFLCIYGPNLNKIGSVISEKIEFFPPTTTTRRRRTITEL